MTYIFSYESSSDLVSYWPILRRLHGLSRKVIPPSVAVSKKNQPTSNANQQRHPVRQWVDPSTAHHRGHSSPISHKTSAAVQFSHQMVSYSRPFSSTIAHIMATIFLNPIIITVKIKFGFSTIKKNFFWLSFLILDRFKQEIR